MGARRESVIDLLEFGLMIRIRWGIFLMNVELENTR